ncbi:MAG TPA: pitrilysin family protein [Candidatus Acidoferrales bacterium]|nr:pitrilysin family protein [Candidatus Acidoferrales bacterium]
MNTKLDRSKPPRPGQEGKVSFPKFFVKKLETGFKFFVVENHALPIVTVGFVARGGSTFDGNLPGLASMTSELISKGTEKRTATEIAEAIDYVGGSLSSSSSWDANETFVSVLRNNLKIGIDLLQDIILHATFPQEEIDRVKTQRIASVQQMKADPGYLADTRFAAVVFGDHPYGRPPVGSEASIKAMKREDFVKFKKDFYTSDNSFMVFAGDVTPAEAEKYVIRYFARWKGDGKSYSVPQLLPSSLNGKIVIVERPGAVQSSLRIGGIGIARNDRNYLKTFVMNTLLGGYFSSRINQNLREKHGYTYGGRSVFDARTLPGPFEVSADVRNEVTGETISESLGELDRIRKTLPSKDELEMVKKYLSGLFPIQLETPQQVARRVVAMELYHLPRNYYKDYKENIRKVTARDVQASAKRYLPEKLSIVLSGDSEKISSMLKKFGKVEILDQDGNKIPK